MTDLEIRKYIELRKSQLNDLKKRYGSRTIESSAGEKLLKSFLSTNDDDTITEIVNGYMPLIIIIIERSFLNCNVSIRELLYTGIQGMKIAIKTSKEIDYHLYDWLAKHIEEAMINFFIKNNREFNVFQDHHYYDNAHVNGINYSLSSLYEKGFYYTNLFLKEGLKPKEIGEIHGYTTANVLIIMKKTLSLFDPKTLGTIQEILNYTTKGCNYIPTIYEFFGDENYVRVNTFLAMLSPDTYEVILAFYPFNRTDKTDKEAVLKKYGYNGNYAYKKFLKLRDSYGDYLTGKTIHPYYLYLHSDIHRMNIFHSFPDVDPNIVKEAITPLIKTYKDFIDSLYDETGSLRISFVEAMKQSGTKEKSFLDKFFRARLSIRKNVDILINKRENNLQPLLVMDAGITSDTPNRNGKRINFVLPTQNINHYLKN